MEMEKKADLEKGVQEKEVEKKSLKSPKVDADLKNDQGNIQYGSVDADIALTYSDAMKPNKCIRICMLFKSLTIEPIMFAFSFAFVMNLSCLSNMMIDKGCVTYFNYSKEICSNLSAYPDAKDNVEKLATDYSMYFNMMSLIGAVAMIFIAPWSDKYGRKLPLFAAFFGITLSDIGLMICSWSLNSQMIYVVLSRIPGEIFGGFICVMTIIYSHASEVSSGARRTCKYTTVEIFFAMGMGLGGFCGGWVYHYYGYFYIYAIATAIHVACLPWIVFVVQETTGQDSRETWREKIRNFFVCENLLKGWKAAVRSRENSGRALILLLFASMCVIVLTYESLSSIAFIYVHHIYDWNPTTYNNVNTIFTLSQIVVLSIIMTLLIRFFPITDYSIGVMGVLSTMVKYLAYSFAHYGVYIYYIGNACGVLNGLVPLTIRSVISKIAEKDELGRVFSFLATCESIVPMLGTVMITKVFNATLNVYPNVTYLMVVGLLTLPLGTFLWAFIYMKPMRYMELNPVTS